MKGKKLARLTSALELTFLCAEFFCEVGSEGMTCQCRGSSCPVREVVNIPIIHHVDWKAEIPCEQ